ncbi:hypothetical protein BGP78_02100 [Pseudoalteromonas sp. MSK9-3]|uniref:hypothetical protein n=1 Tax=Pseudoalteromonas sp. MSK9-3 TaxID=1897633 RepID=UPI000E6D3E6E|nr:hypothetical protein [Pseudoalteromonas sp. MSK9-3]RJE75535.1 hypothetical protein BGP78_02100 [Pseudoalteromonas sp. MSK9-3]
MNLSTSNSDRDNSNTGAPKQSRRVFIKITLAITLVMVTAMGLVRVLLDANGANQQGILGRVLQAKVALPNIIAEPNDLVMFYGSSMVRAGFSPRKFDRDLQSMGKNITSFNFGFGGLNPYYQDLLSRRIAEQFINENRQLKLALIEFNPFQTTTTRWERAQFTVDSYITMLANNAELWQILREDLKQGVHLYNIKYLRNHVSAEMITSYYAREIFPPYKRNVFKDPLQVSAERRKLGRELRTLFKKEYPNYQDEEWYYPWQGAGTIPEERSAHTLEVFDKYYAVTQTDAQMKNDRLSRIRTTDIEDMHFEPHLITSFINIVKNFQRFSDTVEVVMLPKNSRYITYSAAGKLRLSQAIQQIEHATGITIKSHQDIKEVTPDMFRDTTHLSRYRGDIAYTDFLVKEYSDSL